MAAEPERVRERDEPAVTGAAVAVVVAVERPGAVRFPIWQFSESRVLPGLQDVLEILNRDSRLDDWGKVLFFLHTSSRLGGRRPLDLLREKKLPEVLLAAEAYAE